jgi:hypothetical protein
MKCIEEHLSKAFSFFQYAPPKTKMEQATRKKIKIKIKSNGSIALIS